jgi:two-component system response regulator WspF
MDCGELRRAIESRYRIGWVAGNSGETLAQCRGEPPDLLLLDIELAEPGDLTRRIMRDTPCPILLLTRCLDRHVAGIFAAMGAGALDVIDLPPALGADSRALLLRKLKTLARLPASRASTGPARPLAPPLIALGASTGGPKALQRILAGLPANLEAAVVVIQHVEREFSSGMAEWLDDNSPLPVRIAPHDGSLQAGQIYVAGTDDHLSLSRGLRFAYTKEPLALPYRPSVDVFFHSLARHWPEPGLAALLTGMGRDGAEGLAALRGKGWHTLAQDQASSVVYGMPKAARDLGAACEILPLDAIAPALLRWVGNPRTGGM